MLNEPTFTELERRRPRQSAEIWRVASHLQIQRPATGAPRDQGSLLARRDLYRGQTFVPRRSGGRDAAKELLGRLDAQRASERHPPQYVAGEPRSGLSWFLVEFAARYRRDLPFAGLVEGVARRVDSSNSDDDDAFEVQHVSVQLVSLLSLWLGLGEGAGSHEGAVQALLERFHERGAGAAVIVVEGLRAARALHRLLEHLPPTISVLCVCEPGVTLPEGAEIFRLDPLTDSERRAILLREAEREDAGSPALGKIVVELGQDLVALSLAARLLRYSPPVTVLGWLQRGRAGPKRMDSVTLCVRVLREQFGMSDLGSEEGLFWATLTALTWVAPDEPVGLTLLQRSVEGLRPDVRTRHVLRAIEGLTRLHLLGKVGGLPVVSVAVQQAVRDVQRAAERASGEASLLDRASAAVLNAMIEVSISRYDELAPCISRDPLEVDDPILEHLVYGLQGVVDEDGVCVVDGVPTAGLCTLAARTLERLNWLGRRHQARPLLSRLLNWVAADSARGFSAFASDHGDLLDLARLGVELAGVMVEGEYSVAHLGALESMIALAENAPAPPADPEMRRERILARLCFQLARVYARADQVPKAEALLMQADTFAVQANGVEPCLKADVLVRLGDLRARSQRLPLALENLGEAERIYADALAGPSPETAAARMGHAALCDYQMRFEHQLAMEELRALPVAEPKDGGTVGPAVIERAFDVIKRMEHLEAGALETYAIASTQDHESGLTVTECRARFSLQLLVLAMTRTRDACGKYGAWVAGKVLEQQEDLRALVDRRILQLGHLWATVAPDGAEITVNRRAFEPAVATSMTCARASCVYAALTWSEGSAADRHALLTGARDLLADATRGGWTPEWGAHLEWDRRLVDALIAHSAGKESLEADLDAIDALRTEGSLRADLMMLVRQVFQVFKTEPSRRG